MKAVVSMVAACAALAGCAASPDRISGAPDHEICRSYAVFSAGIGWGARAAQYKDEITRRNLLTPEEWQLASERKLRRGMSQCAMYVSWGNPDRENRSVGSWGTHIQHVYHAGLRYVSPTYVYTQNGKVTSWQD